MFAANAPLNAVTTTLRHRYPVWVNPYSRNAALLAVAATLCIGPAHGAQVPDTFELSTLDGTTGFVINGVAESDFSGWSVSGAGDINGDGVDDLIISAYGADPNGSYSGSSYVVFGRRTGFAEAVELSALDGTTGFAINGVSEYDFSGWSVSGAGDINGDGVDDLIIGAVNANPHDLFVAGASYVVFGRRTGFAPALELSALEGTTGFVINGAARGDLSGGAVSGAGDINGDGVDDLIIGATGADPNGNSNSGASYVVFGRPMSTGFAEVLELSALDGSTGFVINGAGARDYSGFSVSGAGDINGDGVDDLIIGATIGREDAFSIYSHSYVVFGRRTGFAAALELSALDGTNGFVINGVAAYDISGKAVSGAGDINGDGVDDLIIGAFLADSNGNINSGASYVVFGKTTSFAAALDLSALDGTTGFVINGVAEFHGSGGSVSSAGDINGDGVDDLIIGATGASPNGFSSGASYVVFGRRTGFPASVELSVLDGSTGFVINGVAEVDESGGSVSGAGDINGDGVDDLIIGARTVDANGNSDSGAGYVVFMPLADTAEATSPQLTIGSTVFASIAPQGDTDQFEFVVPADPFVVPAAPDTAAAPTNTASLSRVVIQTSNDGTRQNYDTKLSLYQLPSEIAGCDSPGEDMLVAINDNIDTAPDRAYSQLVVDLPCGSYRIEVASAVPDRVIPSYALSLSAKPVKILPSHQWHLISLPDQGASSDAMTLEAIFGDELDPATYFNPPSTVSEPTWQAYAYDEINAEYVALALSDSLTTGKAYWIQQFTGAPVTLDTPANFAPPAQLPPGEPCPATSQGCFAINLTATTGADKQLNAVGAPGYHSPETTSMMLSNTGTCMAGCDLATAFSNNLLRNSFYRYDDNAYVRIGGDSVNGVPPVSNTWHPWEGFWGAVLPSALNTSPRLIIPVDQAVTKP